MDFKEYGEQARITFITEAIVNGKLVGRITSETYESTAEQWRKLDNAIREELKEQYEELPESEEL